jgi:hypothetical protein
MLDDGWVRLRRRLARWSRAHPDWPSAVSSVSMTARHSPRLLHGLAVALYVLSAYLGVFTLAVFLVALSPFGGGATALPLLFVLSLVAATAGVIHLAGRVWREGSRRSA